MGTRLYVGNLSYDTSESDLQAHFEQAGSVTSCSIISDKFTNRSRGFGFVEMSSQEEANKAVSMFGGQDLDGRSLTVNEARPRVERDRASSGGGHRDRY